MIGYAIDVSHHQDPNGLPWHLYRGAVDLVIARACYGSGFTDPTVGEHIARARDIGARVGIYHFFRPSQTWTEQARALEDAAYRCGYGSGDVVPAIDIEADPLQQHQDVGPEWEEPTRLLIDAVRSTFGECLVYITRADWHLLGRPSWVLERPIWVAHYTEYLNPAMPGGDVSIQPVLWQHRVGPLLRGGQGGVFVGTTGNPQIDQSRILAPLPLVGGGTWTPAVATPFDEEPTHPESPEAKAIV